MRARRRRTAKGGAARTLRGAAEALALALPALEDLRDDLEALLLQEERLPAGWDVGGLFDRLHAGIAKRYRQITGGEFGDPQAPEPAELAVMVRRLCATLGVECGGARRPGPRIWTDDPVLFEPTSGHVPAYLGAGYERPPVRMELHPDVARRVRPDGTLPEGE